MEILSAADLKNIDELNNEEMDEMQ